jgi:hypothetical protein
VRYFLSRESSGTRAQTVALCSGGHSGVTGTRSRLRHWARISPTLSRVSVVVRLNVLSVNDHWRNLSNTRLSISLVGDMRSGFVQCVTHTLRKRGLLS